MMMNIQIYPEQRFAPQGASAGALDKLNVDLLVWQILAVPKVVLRSFMDSLIYLPREMLEGGTG
jgi:hypothetical protein